MSDYKVTAGKLELLHLDDHFAYSLFQGRDSKGKAFEIEIEGSQFLELCRKVVHNQDGPSVKNPMIVADRVGPMSHMEISSEALTLLQVLANDQASAKAVVDTVNGLIDILAVDSAQEWQDQLEKVRSRLGAKATVRSRG